MELHEWSENVVDVDNHQFLKKNFKFVAVSWVKWKQSVCSITLFYSSTFYSLFLSFFVLEIFKFKYDKVFFQHFASISKFEWSELPWGVTHISNLPTVCVRLMRVGGWVQHSGDKTLHMKYQFLWKSYLILRKKY